MGMEGGDTIQYNRNVSSLSGRDRKGTISAGKPREVAYNIFPRLLNLLSKTDW